jgi:hypothetical protein
MAVKEGWRGRFFEDFEVGDLYDHPLGRTITTTDNIWFTLLSQNSSPIHFDHSNGYPTTPQTQRPAAPLPASRRPSTILAKNTGTCSACLDPAQPGRSM